MGSRLIWRSRLNLSEANAAQLSRFPIAFTVWIFFENVAWFGEKLVAFGASFPCSRLVSEGLDIEGFGGA